MFARERFISPNEDQEDSAQNILRPELLQDFVGQEGLKRNLHVFIEAAKQRGEALDHVLFYGPPGLGKTTLSQIIAHEMGSAIKGTSGPMLTKAGDLAAILTNLKEGDVLFIDEIHRLNSAVEEMLYPAMEDYALDIIVGEGPAARTIKIKLPKFTLIGATTRLGLLSNPLRDRFGIPMKLEFYNETELQQVVARASKLLNIELSQDALLELAKCSRGTPRISLRLLKRIRDFANIEGVKMVKLANVQNSLSALGVDTLGLDNFDRKYLTFILTNFNGGPVGIETIAAAISEDRDSIEDTIEPYLMQIGFLARTPRGRILTDAAREYIKIV